MDFSESDKVTSIRETARTFVERELFPLEQKMRDQGFNAMEPELQKKRALAKETGLYAAHMPESLGGAGLPLVEVAHLAEELARSPIGHYAFNLQAPDVGNMEILLEHGTDAQKERYLLPLVRGDARSCFTMTEPEHPGSNPVIMGTRATKDGDEWVIRGHKWFSSSHEGSAFAICMAVTDPDAAPHQRASMIIVPTDTPGFDRIRNISVMGHAGGGWASHAEVVYQDARVPLSNTLGGEGMGFVIAQHRLGPGRIHHCMRWIGIATRALELMCKHAVEREIAPGTALASKQMVQQWIAESRAEIHGARLMVLHAAWMIQNVGAPKARDEIAMIKFVVARMVQRVLDRAIQSHGALGMTDDTPLAYWFAHERAGRIFDGPDEVHIQSVARRTLRAYGYDAR